jgi:hypothetical protein
MNTRHPFELNLKIALIIYVALTLLITFPAVIELNKSALGCRYTDTWHSLWGISFVKNSLLHGKSLFFTDYIFYPQGGYFYPINLLNAILILPVYLFLSVVVSYNLMIMILMVIAMLGMYRLVLYIARNKYAAFYSGLCYGISPIVITAIHNGTDELLGLCWIPYYALYLLKALDENRMRPFFLSVLFLFLSILSCWYLGFVSLLFTAFFLIYKLSIKGEGIRKRVIFKKIISILLISSMLSLPFFMLLMRSFHGDKRIVNIKVKQEINSTLQNLSYTELSAYFKVIPFWSRKNQFLEQDPRVFLETYDRYHIHGVYLGYIALILCMFGLFSRDKTYPNKRFWLFCAVFFFLLSLGPYPRMHGAKLNLGILEKILPYSLLDRIIPMSSYVSLPFRFSVITYLSLFILAGLGMARAFNKIRIKQKAMLTSAICACTVFEYLIMAPMPYPLYRSPTVAPDFIKELKKQPGEAIIEAPTNHSVYRALRPGLYYQIFHHKKVIYGINVADGISPPLRDNMFIRYIEDICQASINYVSIPIKVSSVKDFFSPIEENYKRAVNPASEDYWKIKDSIEKLKGYSFSYVVIYKDMLPLPVEEILFYFVNEHLGKPYWESKEVVIYRLE